MSAPLLPSGWEATGFVLSSSSPRSAPNCIYTSGNTVQKILSSPTFDFSNKVPNTLTFWERRSSTALTYRLEVRAAINDTNFSPLLARFDTISSTTSYVLRSIDLRSTPLAYQPNVRFLWVLLQDNTNSTGTLRIDDVSLTVATTVDVGVSSVNISPPLPSRCDSVMITAMIRNYATTVDTVPIHFYKDNNGNSRADSDELFDMVMLNQLLEKDSIQVDIQHPPLQTGTSKFFVLTALSSDENHMNDTAVLQCTVGYCQGDVVINEFLYAPTGDEDEWIELTNTTLDTINLRSWKVSDNNTANKATITNEDFFLLPSSYVVLHKDQGFITLHPQALAVRVNFAALNNTTPDAIVLFDGNTRVIDSVRYEPSWGGKNGKSLERIDPLEPSTSRNNWKTTDSTVGTPGFENSVARKTIDLALSNLTATLQNVSSLTWTIQGTITNIGKRPVDPCILRLSIDNNKNMTAEQDEEVASIPIASLAPFDSLRFTSTLTTTFTGARELIAYLDLPTDERPQNNIARAVLNNGYPVSSIVINEIQFAPPEGQCEWMEIYNRSEEVINLRGWTFADRPTATGNRNTFKITDSTTLLSPHHYCIIAADSSFRESYSLLPSEAFVLILNRSPGFSFNNDSDAIALYDETGKCIDSIVYKSSWASVKNASLERIDTEAPALTSHQWASTLSSYGGTPGNPNTVARKQNDIGIARVDKDYSHEHGSWSIHVTITNYGREPVTSFLLTFFLDNNNNALPDLQEELFSTPYVEFIAPLDSLIVTSTIREIPYGDHRLIICLSEEHDEQPRNNSASLVLQTGYPYQSIVITELCYDPPSGQCEWMEIYNRTPTPISLFRWTFADKPTSSGSRNKFSITDSALIIPPYRYAVIAADSIFIECFPHTVSTCAIAILNRPSGFSFNNDSDGITLFDPYGNCIDSILYSATWATRKNGTLERIDTELPALDSTNWCSTESPEGGTPGLPNTVERKQYDLVLKSVISQWWSDSLSLIVTVHNVGRLPSHTFSIICYLDSNNSMSPEPGECLLTKSCSSVLAPYDSILQELTFLFSFPGSHKITVTLLDSSDERPTNNTRSVLLQRSYPLQAIVINEILFNPLDGQNEWFELYNRSSMPIDLKHWTVSDAPTPSGARTTVRLCDSSYILAPYEYCCIAADSSIFSLYSFEQKSRVLVTNRSSGFSFGNECDAVVLKDHTGTIIDSVYYTTQWHYPGITDTKGRSLERLSPELHSNDPRAWSTCILPVGGTPARENSVSISLQQTENTITLSPNPFSPDGDGYEDFCALRFSVPFPSFFVTVRIFDIRGRLIRTLAQHEFHGRNDALIWNGYDDRNRRVRIGIYIALIEILDNQSGITYSYKKPIVVGTKR